MDLVSVYKCLCDLTRLRILHLLGRRPLCVCFMQDILREPQVKISKHLRYLRDHGMVVAERRANWIIYRLPDSPNPVLVENLRCLQDLIREQKVFQMDLERLGQIDASEVCAPKAVKESQG